MFTNNEIDTVNFMGFSSNDFKHFEQEPHAKYTLFNTAVGRVLTCSWYKLMP